MLVWVLFLRLPLDSSAPKPFLVLLCETMSGFAHGKEPRCHSSPQASCNLGWWTDSGRPLALFSWILSVWYT